METSGTPGDVQLKVAPLFVSITFKSVGSESLANLGDTSDGSVPLMNKCVSTKLSGVYSLANWAGMVSSSTFTELIPPGLVNFEFFSNKLFKSTPCILFLLFALLIFLVLPYNYLAVISYYKLEKFTIILCA